MTFQRRIETTSRTTETDEKTPQLLRRPEHRFLHSGARLSLTSGQLGGVQDSFAWSRSLRSTRS